MLNFIEKRRKFYTDLLDSLPERDRPIYDEENTKVAIRAKLNFIEELLEIPQSEWSS
jgi:hypothetical protein